MKHNIKQNKVSNDTQTVHKINKVSNDTQTVHKTNKVSNDTQTVHKTNKVSNDTQTIHKTNKVSNDTHETSNQVPVPVTSPKLNQSFQQTKLKTRTPSKTFWSIPAGTENEIPVLIAVPAPVLQVENPFY